MQLMEKMWPHKSQEPLTSVLSALIERIIHIIIAITEQTNYTNYCATCECKHNKLSSKNKYKLEFSNKPISFVNLNEG